MILVFFVSLALLTWLICRELEQDVASSQQNAGDCVGCGGQIESDWLICPRCQTLSQQHCPACGQTHACGDDYCPWCGKARQERAA